LILATLSQRSGVGTDAGIAPDLDQAGDRGRRDHDGHHREREDGGDVGYRVILLMGEVQHELDADEREDQRQTGRQIQEPVEQSGDEEEQSSQTQ
jgi:hypothetical protein